MINGQNRNKNGERVREADGKRAKKLTLAPSLKGGGWGWVQENTLAI